MRFAMGLPPLVCQPRCQQHETSDCGHGKALYLFPTKENASKHMACDNDAGAVKRPQ
jgi:hypothetical protein